MQRSTAYKCIYDVMHALFHEFATMWDNPYRSSDRVAEMAQKFMSKYGLPGVIGVVDGSHIPIQRRSRGRNDKYYNRKGFMSVILQAIVDADGRFVNIDVGEKGARHDAYVFKSSDIGIWFESTEASECVQRGAFFLLGDSAYRLRWHTQKAFNRANAVPQELINDLRKVNSAIGRK